MHVLCRSTDKSLDSLGLEEEEEEGRLAPFNNINTMLKAFAYILSKQLTYCG
jgi:hypothetical protein